MCVIKRERFDFEFTVKNIEHCFPVFGLKFKLEKYKKISLM